MLAAPQGTAASLLAITAMDANGYGSNLSVKAFEGWRFRPNEDIFVHEAGFQARYANGLIRACKVGIVAPDNTVLESAIVPSGTAGRLDGPFDPGRLDLAGSGSRYMALQAPLRLTAGHTYAGGGVHLERQHGSDAVAGLDNLQRAVSHGRRSG